MDRFLPPFFYPGGKPTPGETINPDAIPFLPSQAAQILQCLKDAARKSGTPEPNVPTAWLQIQGLASMTQERLRLEWSEKRNRKKPPPRLMERLKRIADKGIVPDDEPGWLYDAILYGAVRVGVLDPEYRDEPHPLDGPHPGLPFLRRLTPEQVRQAIGEARDKRGMLHQGKGGRPKGTAHGDYIREIVAIYQTISQKPIQFANPYGDDPSGPLIRFVSLCLKPVHPRLSVRQIATILNELKKVDRLR